MKKLALMLIAATAVVATGCGAHAQLEARDRQILELQTELDSARGREQGLARDVERAHEQLDHLSRIVNELGTPVERLERDNDTLRRQLEAAEAAVGDLARMHAEDEAAFSADLEAAQRALEDLRARERLARTRLETYRSLLQRFSEMISAGRLRVRVVRNQIVVELPEAVLFDSGRDRIKPEGREVLEQVSEVLASIVDRQFRVAGHTDNVPIHTSRFPSNWELSTARAVNVVKLMIEQGLGAQRLSAAGYADTQPVGSNDTEEGRQQNRRIEIALVPNLDELPDLSALQLDES